MTTPGQIVQSLKRAYYSAPIEVFCSTSPDEILGILTRSSDFPVVQEQREAWLNEVRLLKGVIHDYRGGIYLEYSIPRMGRRIDAVLLIGPVLVVLEFKVGEAAHTSAAIDQVYDYALDLKNFHQTSHNLIIAPILVATEATHCDIALEPTRHDDRVFRPFRCGAATLRTALQLLLGRVEGSDVDKNLWEAGRYQPTPTIIEAAKALYGGHSVAEISRSDASAVNLSSTSGTVAEIITDSRDRSRKSVVFVTGVPGAGKTLVGLDIATKHIDPKSALYSVFLSGNGPLVDILREALARDRVAREYELGKKLAKGRAQSEVKAFIQNVHNFRDECMKDMDRPPIEHVALFDEAQRAWTLAKTADFMKRRKRIPDFNVSEPAYLISCLDRHEDWAVVVCLVGGGQEIHTGEAGISEWINAVTSAFPSWDIHVSPRLFDEEYSSGRVMEQLRGRPNVTFRENLHLAVSMRSFRTENVSLLVKQILDIHGEEARGTLSRIGEKYPIVLTRNLKQAKGWLREMARGSERYGLLVSSYAERLRPHGVFVRAPMEPVHWFLDGKDDIRSSYYLEDVATEFSVQGLELDWTCVTWDADFRFSPDGWAHRSFLGNKWKSVHQSDRKTYQKNAYRVLLTRARQGMVVCVPEGDPNDSTRLPEFYDSTFEYLEDIGFPVI